MLLTQYSALLNLCIWHEVGESQVWEMRLIDGAGSRPKRSLSLESPRGHFWRNIGNIRLDLCLAHLLHHSNAHYTLRSLLLERIKSGDQVTADTACGRELLRITSGSQRAYKPTNHTHATRYERF